MAPKVHPASSADPAILPRLVRVVCTLLVLAVAAHGQPVAGCCELRIQVRGAEQQPLAAAQAEIFGPGRVMSERTDSKGAAQFTLPRPGTYRVSLSKDGYFSQSRAVEAGIGDTITLEFTLIPQFAGSQTVTVNAPADASAVRGDSATGTDVRATPDRPATLREALPLIPGVVRTPEGKLVISDSGEHRNSLLVDSLDATDPATGSFGATVPVDSVIAFTVYKSPFLAEFGRFTSGVVVVNTRGGGDAWHWELNDPTPELRLLGGHLRGIRGWTPRLNVAGPIIRNHLYTSESLEYVYKQTPVRTLSSPHNEDKRYAWNSLTRFDYVLSASQLLTAKFHVAPQRLMFQGLGFYNPQPATPNRWGHEGMADLSHSISMARGILQSAVSIAEVSARVAGQGGADLVITPTGNLGNYFMYQSRRARKVEWLENWTSRQIGASHNHTLKLGVSIVAARGSGSFRAQPVSIVGAQHELLERIQFANRGGYQATDWETGVYAHDHWVVSPKVSVDAGLRFERQRLTGVGKIAPRAAIAWSPFSRPSTTFRAGLGWFYDRVPLAVAAFNSYPERTVIAYTPGGDILAGPITYANTLGTVESDRGALVFGRKRPGNFAPRSLIWRFEAEHAISGALHLRASYWQGKTRGLMVIDPVSGEGSRAMLLNGTGRSGIRQFELVSKVAVRGDRRLFLSYVHGNSQSNLNEFSEFLGDYPAAVVRPDVYATTSSNIPHRFLAWGTIPLAPALRKSTARLPSLAFLQLRRGWLVAPVAEYRTGFPYSRLDERQRYAGTPNSWRFPNFFSLDIRVAKNIAVREHAVQFSFSLFNATNHWNPESVRWNTADYQVGEFLGQRPRRFRIDFDLLF